MSYTQSFLDGLPPECLQLPQEFLDENWINDPKNLPYSAQEENQFVFKAEDDYLFAIKKQRGVLFDLMKQLYGCSFLETDDLFTENGENVEDLTWEELQDIESVTNIRTYKPNPAQYQWWAWTAHALLNGDITELNIRGTYKNSLDGGDVSKIINKLGFWKLDGEIEKNKRLTLTRFAPLYARMYNNDPRYTSGSYAVKKLKEKNLLEESFSVPVVQSISTGTGFELLTKPRESPLKFCTECKVIIDVWADKKIRPGDSDYDKYYKKVRNQVAQAKQEKDAKPDQSRYTMDKYKFVKIGSSV